LENPLTNPEIYAKKYGVPLANVKNADFIETAVIKPDGKFITREAPTAPGAAPGAGGGVEVVVEQGGTTGNVVKPIKH
jgi:hypothetical protein